MIEPEAAKGMTLIVAGASAKIGSMLGSGLTPDPLSWMMEFGGNGVAIGLLYLGLRHMRSDRDEEKKEKKEAQAKLQEMHEARIAEKEKDVESRLKLAAALEKLNEKKGE